MVADLGPGVARAGRAGRPPARRRGVERHGRDPRDVATGSALRRCHPGGLRRDRAGGRRGRGDAPPPRRPARPRRRSPARPRARHRPHPPARRHRARGSSRRGARPRPHLRAPGRAHVRDRRCTSRARGGRGRRHRSDGVSERPAGGGRDAGAGPHRSHDQRRALRSLLARGPGPRHPPPPDAPGAGAPISRCNRVVLSSSPDGQPARSRLGAARPRPRRSLLRRDDPGEVEVEVDPTDEPFWLVVGQSHSTGWDVSVDGGSAGELDRS